MNAPYSLDVMIAAHIAAGFEVTFTAGFGADPVAAHVEKSGDPDAGCTALGCTAAAALWAASPLHDDAEPYPGEDMTPGAIDSHSWRCAGCGGQCIGTEPGNKLCRGCAA